MLSQSLLTVGQKNRNFGFVFIEQKNAPIEQENMWKITKLKKFPKRGVFVGHGVGQAMLWLNKEQKNTESAIADIVFDDSCYKKSYRERQKYFDVHDMMWLINNQP